MPINNTKEKRKKQNWLVVIRPCAAVHATVQFRRVPGLSCPIILNYFIVFFFGVITDDNRYRRRRSVTVVFCTEIASAPGPIDSARRLYNNKARERARGQDAAKTGVTLIECRRIFNGYDNDDEPGAAHHYDQVHTVPCSTPIITRILFLTYHL